MLTRLILQNMKQICPHIEYDKIKVQFHSFSLSAYYHHTWITLLVTQNFFLTFNIPHDISSSFDNDENGAENTMLLYVTVDHCSVREERRVENLRYFIRLSKCVPICNEIFDPVTTMQFNEFDRARICCYKNHILSIGKVDQHFFNGGGVSLNEI